MSVQRGFHWKAWLATVLLTAAFGLVFHAWLAPRNAASWLLLFSLCA